MRSSGHNSPAAIGLKDNCVHLAGNGSMRCRAKTAEFLANVVGLRNGLTLALFHANGPHDVHYPIWEMHPEGDELLVLVSGSMSVEFRGEEERARLSPQEGVIVPAGIWHRLVVQEPSVLIAITARRNTRHEK